MFSSYFLEEKLPKSPSKPRAAYQRQVRDLYLQSYINILDKKTGALILLAGLGSPIRTLA